MYQLHAGVAHRCISWGWAYMIICSLHFKQSWHSVIISVYYQKLSSLLRHESYTYL